MRQVLVVPLVLLVVLEYLGGHSFPVQNSCVGSGRVRESQ